MPSLEVPPDLSQLARDSRYQVQGGVVSASGTGAAPAANTAAAIDLWLVTHEELRHSARIRAVFDFIAERALAETQLFERGTRE